MGKGSSGASGAAQTSANTQSSALNQIEQLIASMQGMSGGISSMLGGSGLGSLESILQLGTDPSALAALTGVNAPGMIKNATSALTPFYTNEMNNGINPQFATNAQSQLQQQFAQSNSDILASTGPGQNPAARQQQAQDQLLSSSTNLAGNLAGQSQQFANQGAAGLASTAQLGAGYNQSTLQEMLSTLSPLLGFLSGGNNSALGALGGISGQAGQQEEYFSNMANQQQQQQGSKWSSLLTSPGASSAEAGIGNWLGNMLLTGAMA